MPDTASVCVAQEKPRVLVGMSGGVDSSVAAALLKKQGYQVIGATMKLWEDRSSQEIEGGCCSFRAADDAKQVCSKLQIPHYTFNCETEFKQHVIDDFVHCYENCKTPNPCVECNKYLKFGAFYQKAIELECNYISTGHYAKVEYSEKYHTHVLKKSEAEKKDQTYFLYGIPKEVLPKMIFPLEKIPNKEEVRKIAEDYDLKVAHKKDSQEVCFIPDDDYGKFLKEKVKLKPKEGNIVLKDGTILGKHEGLIYYTVGQRKGMGIAYKEPLYVLRLNQEKNEVIVGTKQELYTNKLYANELNFLLDMDFSNPISIMAKIRYRSPEAKAILKVLKDKENRQIAEVIFEESQRAITPGQSVVFYLEDIVLGGGKIM
ncbi:MAG: tRNA 2-thiouridine(34) synthase MnmA [Clostridia bacterium]|nr:tRNA 2-thiouridine(34) synthase MnmA [Clostridia bacterium]